MNEQSHEKGEVLVIGAGPTGLVMAAELARRGIACRIIDKAPAPTQLSRALAIQSRTLEVFEQMGIIEETLAHGIKIQKVNFYAERKPIMHLGLAELDSPYPFMLDLPQSETERIVGEHLQSLGIRVEREVELLNFIQDADAVNVSLRHPDGHVETVSSPWLIGCDGAHSTTRHLLNIPFKGEAFLESFALADVQLEWPLPNDEVHLFLHSSGILAAFPMPEGRYRLIVETSTHANAEDQADPTLEDFQGYLDERGPAGTRLSDPRWLAPFRVSSRKVEHYRQGRVFLAGDAAHIHSPAGGQGMNTGIQDVYNLAWKLALVTTGEASLSLLDTYEVERSPVAEAVLHETDLMLKMATLQRPIEQRLRSLLLPLLAQQELIQQQLRKQISELAINYRKSPLAVEHYSQPLARLPFKHGPRAGDCAVDAQPLIRSDGTTARLFEILRNKPFTLLLFAGIKPIVETWQQIETLAESVNGRYSKLIQVYLVVAGDVVPESLAEREIALLDPKLALHHGYKADTQCLYLLRPDGYIGFLSRPVDAAGLWEYLGWMNQARA